MTPCSQTGDTRFEVASVKPSAPGTQGIIQNLPGGRFIATRVTTEFLLTTAFAVPARRIRGGPAWLDSDRFDVKAIASSEQGTDALAPEKNREMLRNLLSTRFGLSCHREKRELSVLALVVLRHKEGLQPSNGQPYEIRRSRHDISFHNVSMSQLADNLSGRFTSDELDRVVIDKTGLTGAFDFVLGWVPPPPQSSAAKATPSEAPSVFSALKELGLALRPAKAQVDILVIDSIHVPFAD